MRVRLTYSNVVATIALFIALGGGAYAAFSLPAGSVKSEQIARNAVRSLKIAKRAVKRRDVARNAIRSRKIKNRRVKSWDLADGSVSSPKLADAAVTTAKLSDGSVTPPKLGDLDYARVEGAGTTGSVTPTEIAPAGPEIEVTLGANVYATVLAQATMTAAGGATEDDCRFGVSVSGEGFDVQLPFEGGATFSGGSPGPRTEYAYTLPPLPGGTLSFRMVYRRAGGDDPCTFSNRRLWVEVSEP